MLEKGLIAMQKKVGINMDVKDHSCEISDRNEEYMVGNWRGGNPHYKETKNLAELCFVIGSLSRPIHAPVFFCQTWAITNWELLLINLILLGTPFP